MANKYHTGDFLLITFDEIGTRQKSEPFGTFNQAKTYFEETKKDTETCAIVRVIYNSGEQYTKWTH